MEVRPSQGVYRTTPKGKKCEEKSIPRTELEYGIIPLFKVREILASRTLHGYRDRQM